MARERLACLIVARNLGDAVIQSGVLEKLIESDYAERYIVWCRPQVAFLFKDLERTETVCSQFPVGTTKQFGLAQAMAMLSAARRIRKLQPSVSLDLIGDFRERFFAWMAGAGHHLHIGWDKDHPFSKIIRNPLGTGRPAYVAPKSVSNIYQAYSAFVSVITGRENTSIGMKPSDRPLERKSRRVGLHPFASQECKLWPDQCWRELAQRLVSEGWEVIAYGSPLDRPALDRIFGLEDGLVHYFTKSLPEFTDDITRTDLLIGLDSFSVHLAEHKRIPCVVIYAGNVPDLWAPPMSVQISSDGGCSHYPCLNKAKCVGGENEYSCVRSLTVDNVFEAAKRVMANE